MAIDIVVFDDFRIVSSEMNVTVYRKNIVDPTQSPNWEERKAKGASSEKRVEWSKPTYHGTVDKAFKSIADQRVLEVDATTIDELLHEIRRIRREISDVLSVREQ